MVLSLDPCNEKVNLETVSVRAPVATHSRRKSSNSKLRGPGEVEGVCCERPQRVV